MSFLSRLFSRPKQAESVSFDGERVVHTLPDGIQESVRWDELQEVSIITTDGGPWIDDVHWVFVGQPGGCAVSSTVQGTKELLERLQQLPGFRSEEVIRAMGSTSNAKFICWQRDAAIDASPSPA